MDKVDRIFEINISENKMQAFLTIKYKLKSEFVNFDNIISKDELTILDKASISLLTFEEIYNELVKKGIKYGIIKDNLTEIVEKEKILKVLVANGTDPIDDGDEVIKLNFNVDEENKFLKEDKRGRVDFKSIGSVTSVAKDDIIAEKIPGKEGKDGTNVLGEKVPHKIGKKVQLKVATGCKLVNDSKVQASIFGKPSIKNNVFYVFQDYTVSKDVDITTGNISFVGDLHITGNIFEGMKVLAGNNLIIDKNVEGAYLYAGGNAKILGSLMNSSLKAGGNDLEKVNEIRSLSSLIEELEKLMATIEEVKKFNLLGYDTPDGQIIKVLIENKFKKIPSFCMQIIKNITVKNDKEEADINILEIIKNKLIGLGPINIKFYSELYNLIDILKNKVSNLNEGLAIPVTVDLNYCQDCNIESSGSINITGSGTYISNLTAKTSITFTSSNGVMRGGVLTAGTDIKCKTVGAKTGVNTKLCTSNTGNIYADIAYENTTFVVGTKEYTLDCSCKDIHAYINEERELIVDKLKL